MAFFETYLYPCTASSQARVLNSSYIFRLKFSRRKNDQNRNRVFISCDFPGPTRFRSGKKRHIYSNTWKIHSVRLTVWSFQDFSFIEILRENNFGVLKVPFFSNFLGFHLVNFGLQKVQNFIRIKIQSL